MNPAGNPPVGGEDDVQAQPTGPQAAHPDRLATVRSNETDPDILLHSFVQHLTVIADARSRSQHRPGWAWGSAEELLLATASPNVVDTLTLPEGTERGRVRECFYNAFMLTLAHPHLTYTEGYAMAGFFPVNHAWCTDMSTGAIVDPTWINLDYDGPYIYWGLPFSRGFMQKILDTGDNHPSVFESDWRRKGKTARCGLVRDTDGIVIDWGDSVSPA